MILLALLLQTTPVAPIVKGTGLPPPGTEEAAILAPVQALLAALERSDGPGILAVTRPEGRATAALEGPDGRRGIRSRDWASFAAGLKPGPDRFTERLTGTPAIEIDGDVAMLWSPYEVTINGQLSHCGYDHVELVRETGQWRILNVTWSQRTTGCRAS